MATTFLLANGCLPHGHEVWARARPRYDGSSSSSRYAKQETRNEIPRNGCWRCPEAALEAPKGVAVALTRAVRKTLKLCPSPSTAQVWSAQGQQRNANCQYCNTKYRPPQHGMLARPKAHNIRALSASSRCRDAIIAGFPPLYIAGYLVDRTHIEIHTSPCPHATSKQRAPC